MHPYRDPAVPALGPQPWCHHQLGPGNKAALAAVGGWWHGDDCMRWHTRLYQQNPKDIRIGDFLKTLNRKHHQDFFDGKYA